MTIKNDSRILHLLMENDRNENEEKDIKSLYDSYVYDTGSNIHVFNNTNLFFKYNKIETDEKINGVSNVPLQIEGKGDTIFGEAKYSPDAPTNII